MCQFHIEKTIGKKEEGVVIYINPFKTEAVII